MRFLICFLLTMAAPLFSQEENSDITVYESLELSGPRIGLSYLSESFTNTIKRDAEVKLKPFMAQFGWQFEKRFFFTQRRGYSRIRMGRAFGWL